MLGRARSGPARRRCEPEMDALLTPAADERGVSRSEFIRQQLALVLEQWG